MQKFLAISMGVNWGKNYLKKTSVDQNKTLFLLDVSFLDIDNVCIMP